MTHTGRRSVACGLSCPDIAVSDDCHRWHVPYRARASCSSAAARMRARRTSTGARVRPSPACTRTRTSSRVCAPRAASSVRTHAAPCVVECAFPPVIVARVSVLDRLGTSCRAPIVDVSSLVSVSMCDAWFSCVTTIGCSRPSLRAVVDAQQSAHAAAASRTASRSKWRRWVEAALRRAAQDDEKCHVVSGCSSNRWHFCWAKSFRFD